MSAPQTSPPPDPRPAPDPHAPGPTPPRLRPRFAALGLVGGVMVCLPLVQLLQYQAAELEWAQTQRTALDPAADAVAVQRSLLAHGDTAGQVLRGRPHLEPQRRARQTEVDGRLTRLVQALNEGHWGPALDESRLLSQDWQQLADQVVRRQISARDSDDSHRLRVEQVLQVLDLLALAWAPGHAPALADAGRAADGQRPPAGALPAGPAAPAALASALTLPRLAGQWAELSASSDAAARRAALQALQHQLRPLRAASAAGSDRALASATERADARARRWLDQLAATQAAAAGQPAAGGPEHPPTTGSADPQPLRAAALQALFELQAAASGHSLQALDARLQTVHLQRAGTLAALAALLAASLWWARTAAGPGAPRAPVAPPPPARAHAPSAPRGPESAPVAEHLLQRLQQPRADHGQRPPPTPRDAQPSLPPEF